MMMLPEDCPATDDYAGWYKYDVEDYTEDDTTEFLDYVIDVLTQQLEDEEME